MGDDEREHDWFSMIDNLEQYRLVKWILSFRSRTYSLHSTTNINIPLKATLNLLSKLRRLVCSWKEDEGVSQMLVQYKRLNGYHNSTFSSFLLRFHFALLSFRRGSCNSTKFRAFNIHNREILFKHLIFLLRWRRLIRAIISHGTSFEASNQDFELSRHDQSYEFLIATDYAKPSVVSASIESIQPVSTPDSVFLLY